MSSLVQPSPQKTAVITGSTSGIGLDLANDLHQRGWNVVISGRREALGKEIASKLDATGETTLFVRCEVSSHDEQAALFKAAWNKWHRIDVFVANAGAVDQGSIYQLDRKNASVEDVPSAPDLSCTDIDFKGVVYGTQLATHYMRHNPTRGGKIIVTGSIAGVYSIPTWPEYCGAKAGVISFVRAAAPVLKKQHNITFNQVLPNAYVTGIAPGSMEAYLDEHLTKRKALMDAYFIFIDDEANEKNGQNVEAAYDKLYFHDKPPYQNEVVKRTEKPYEPWFEALHGARSELEWAIKEPMRKAN